MNPRTFTVLEFAAATGLDEHVAGEFLEHFATTGIVRRVGDSYAITEKGWRLSGAMGLA